MPTYPYAKCSVCGRVFFAAGRCAEHPKAIKWECSGSDGSGCVSQATSDLEVGEMFPAAQVRVLREEVRRLQERVAVLEEKEFHRLMRGDT